MSHASRVVPLFAALAVASLFAGELAGHASAQAVVSYYAPYYDPAPVAFATAPTPYVSYYGAPYAAPVAYAPAQTTVYRPFLPWRPTVVSTSAYAPAPALAPVAVAAPAAVTTSRYRPVMGGTITRTRYMAPATTVIVP